MAADVDSQQAEKDCVVRYSLFPSVVDEALTLAAGLVGATGSEAGEVRQA